MAVRTIMVASDPNGVVTGTGGEVARLNVSPWTQWTSLGGTIWREDAGLDTLGLCDCAAHVGLLAGWTDLATAVPIGGSVVALTDAALMGTPRHRAIRFAPKFDGAAVRVSGLVQAVGAGEFIRGLNVDLEWTYPHASPVTGATDLRAALVFLTAAGELLRGVGWEIDGGTLSSNAVTFVRCVHMLGTPGANDIVTTAWDNPAAVTGAVGVPLARQTMWLQRHADNTLSAWSGAPGGRPQPSHYLSPMLAAAAGAGFVGIVCYANAGITAGMPTIAIRSQLAAPAALPWS